MGANAKIGDIEAIWWSGDPYDRLYELRGARDVIDHMIEQAVIECRTNAVEHGTDLVTDKQGHTETRETDIRRPVSWRKIGDALGIAGQSAHQRFAHLVEK